jgi:hypothetical protein
MHKSLALSNGQDATRSKDLHDDVAEVVAPGSIDFLRSLADEELDRQVIATTAGLEVLSRQTRREIQNRLLPLLLVLRERFRQPGRRTAIPGCPSWTEYLRDRGLKADTVRSWFRRSRSADEVAELLGETKPKRAARPRDPELQPGDVAGLLLAFDQKLAEQALQVFGSLAIDEYVVALRRFVEGIAVVQQRNILVHLVPE